MSEEKHDCRLHTVAWLRQGSGSDQDIADAIERKLEVDEIWYEEDALHSAYRKGWKDAMLHIIDKAENRLDG